MKHPPETIVDAEDQFTYDWDYTMGICNMNRGWLPEMVNVYKKQWKIIIFTMLVMGKLTSFRLGHGFQSKLFNCQRVNPIKSYQTIIFLWFPYGFPMLFLWFSYASLLLQILRALVEGAEPVTRFRPLAGLRRSR